MADPTFAKQMVEKLQALLLARKPFVGATVDGQTITQESIEVLERSLAKYERRVAREQGRRKAIRTIYLG